MSNPESEKLVNYLVALNKPGRRISYPEASRWGALIEPDPDENPSKTDRGIRVALFGSWEFGYVVLETLKSLENQFPEKINMVGFVTDDPVNPDARISVKKRIWGLEDLPERVIDETILLESALAHGIPSYTGEIKTDYFRNLLRSWNPDVILVCVFGQMIDAFIIDYPAYGIYNFHPSDLAHGYGAGTSPYADLATRQASFGTWCVHRVTEQIDSGPIIGQSPPICVVDSDGKLPSDQFIVYNRLAEGLGTMVLILSREIYRHVEKGAKSPVGAIDFPAHFSTVTKERLKKPILFDHPVNLFLGPDPDLFI